MQSILYVVAFVIVLRTIWQSINVAETWCNRLTAEAEREDELAPVIKLSVMLGRILTFAVGTFVLLAYFGIDVFVAAATLGIGGLAISLAARDIIAGITILLDRPFRIGDRIEIQALDTWGDVVDIGLRTTRVRTRDNRMVIVPNSVIVKNEVVNYTFPDSRYRIQTHVGIAYGANIEATRQLIVDTVRQVEEVLEDKPVDALYNEMGDSAMIFRVRWWIESYTDTRRILDRVHTSIQTALDADSIEIPFPTASQHVQLEPETIGELTAAIWSANGQKKS